AIAGERTPEAHRQARSRQVPAPLLVFVGVMAPDDHADSPSGVRDHRREAGLHVAEAELLDDLGDENSDPDADPGLAKMDRPKRKHPPVEQRLEYRDAAASLDCLLLLFHLT